MTFKIYTKTGDTGETSLIGGTRVPKHHLKIETYGTVDELNSHIGIIRDTFEDANTRELLLEIKNNLFVIGSHLAEDKKVSKMKLPEIDAKGVARLEVAIDQMNDLLPELKNFILPGGNVIVSYCHIARCVCRRAERCITHLSELEKLDELIEPYMNRLSDYLFVLARFVAYKLDVPEIPWQPRQA